MFQHTYVLMILSFVWATSSLPLSLNVVALSYDRA
jgi:hypothetical protein